MAQAIQSTIASLSIAQAAGEIVRLINERPSSPHQGEVEGIISRAVARHASDALISITGPETRLLEAISECQVAQAELVNVPDDQYEAAAARFHAALDHLDKLEAQLPRQPRSMTDIVLRAHVAFSHADKDRAGGLADLEAGDALGSAARLIEAVLQFAGVGTSN